MFLNPVDYPFTKILQEAYPRIRREMEAIPVEHYRKWYEKRLYTNLWLVYGLYALGNPIKEHCQKCPETVKAVKQIPGLMTAGFSMLMPGTHIQPHEGYTKMVLRCHLGLSVPEPDKCLLRVNGVNKHWEEGQCMVFDDTLMHEAWNEGGKPRVVLLIDFMNPDAKVSWLKRRLFFLSTHAVKWASHWLGAPKEKKLAP